MTKVIVADSEHLVHGAIVALLADLLQPSLPAYLTRSIDFGASGFLVKNTPPEHLARAIRRIGTRKPGCRASVRPRCPRERPNRAWAAA